MLPADVEHAILHYLFQGVFIPLERQDRSKFDSHFRRIIKQHTFDYKRSDDIPPPGRIVFNYNPRPLYFHLYSQHMDPTTGLIEPMIDESHNSRVLRAWLAELTDEMRIEAEKFLKTERRTMLGVIAQQSDAVAASPFAPLTAKRYVRLILRFGNSAISLDEPRRRNQI